MDKKYLKVIALILVLPMILVLYGCKSEEGTETDTPSSGADIKTKEEPSEPTNLVFWGWQGDLEDAWLNHLIPDFESQNSNAKVEMVLMPWDQYWQKVQTSIVSNSLPDLLTMSVAYVDQYAASETLINLKSYIDKGLDRSLYYEAGIKTVRCPSVETGDEYAFPWNMVCNTLFYNTTIFDKEGVSYPTSEWTWDDLLKAAQDLTKITDDPATSQYGFASTYSYTSLDSVIYAHGGSIVSSNLKECRIDSPEAVEAITLMIDMIHKYKVSPALGDVSADSMSFGSGQVAMEIGGAWSLAEYGEANKFEWDIAPLPKGPSGRGIRAWSDSIAITKDSKNPDLAWEFIKFFVSDKGQTIENLTATRIPILISAAESDAWLQPGVVPKNKKVLVDYLAESDPLVFRGGWNEWNPIVENEMLLAFIGDKSVEEAVTDAKNQIQAVLDKQ